MKLKEKHMIYFGLLIAFIIALTLVFCTYNKRIRFDSFGVKSNSPYVSCSSYTPAKCPTRDCMVITDETQCAGNSKPSGLEPGEKNENSANSAYMNSYFTGSNVATCDSAGYLKTCVTRSLQ
jgi:hypothetical protein